MNIGTPNLKDRSMFQFLIKYSLILPLLCLNVLLGCQLFESEEIPKITNKTNDYDLCFPVEYSRLFDLPDDLRFQYLKDVQVRSEDVV